MGLANARLLARSKVDADVRMSSSDDGGSMLSVERLDVKLPRSSVHRMKDCD